MRVQRIIRREQAGSSTPAKLVARKNNLDKNMGAMGLTYIM